MYKKLDLEQLCNVWSNFFNNLKQLYKSQKYVFFKEFLKDCFKEWNDIYYFESNQPVFKISKKWEKIYFFDEKDKIELEVNQDEITKMHTILKDDKKISKINDNKSIIEELIDWFLEGNMNEIWWKPYIVYDIETVWDINNLKNMKFILGYSVISTDPHKDSIKYKYIWEDSLKKYVDYLLNFEGFIVWYNNIFFDNPVVCHNLWLWKDIIQKLNEKSLDIFLFLRNLTGKRYSLDKVSKSLVSIGKTLSSWKEATDLLIQFAQTKDPALLTKVRNYCRNDVKMTFWVLLYLLKNQKVYLDWEYVDFTISDMVNLWNKEKNSNWWSNNWNNNIASLLEFM